MAKLILRFALPLEQYELKPYSRPGPVFHRWLPDGKKDSIVLVDEQQRATLEIWFERRGYVDEGMIVFDHAKSEVDVEIMERQAVLDAGPLRGSLVLEEVTEETLAPVRNGEIGHELYVALGKQIVKNILEPQLVRILDILKVNYGQYWIRGLDKWDSRQRSLGQHCNLLNLYWSLDEGSTWDKFIPDEPKNEPITLMFSENQFSSLMTKEDWVEFRDAVVSGHSPSLAAVILSRSHENLDRGAIKYALIDGVTALELAIDEFVRLKLPATDLMKPLTEQILRLSLPAKAAWICSMLSKIESADLETAVGTIAMRNDVVHEGKELPEEATDSVRCLQKAISCLLAGPDFKFPPIPSGNRIYPKEGPGPKLFAGPVTIS